LYSASLSITPSAWFHSVSRRPSQLNSGANATSSSVGVRRAVQREASEICRCGLRVSTKPLSGTWQLPQCTLPASPCPSFTWPITPQRVDLRDEITYYNKSRAVDDPFIATLTQDRRWVVASFTRTTGTLWSNPELTCQHVDPQAALSPGEEVVLETKILVVRGSLDDVFAMAMRQRDSVGK
jgi:hypothetical protein